MSVVAKVRYHERLVQWTPAGNRVRPARCGNTRSASATIKVDGRGRPRLVAGEPSNPGGRDSRRIRSDRFTLRTAHTRSSSTLVNIDGNSLALDRLLPGREIARGRKLEITTGPSIAPLLGHGPRCRLRSQQRGHRRDEQPSANPAGRHGSRNRRRSTDRNRVARRLSIPPRLANELPSSILAIQEKRTPSEVVPGLDIVAQDKDDHHAPAAVK